MELNHRAVTALITLRNAVRDVARSLLDDGPHTYVASVSSVLSAAIGARRDDLASPTIERVRGELTGIVTVLEVLPRDPWQTFTVDAARCAAKLMVKLTPDIVEKEERCVATLIDEAERLCRLPETRDIDTPYGAFRLVREDHGRVLAVCRTDDDEAEPLFRTRGALSDAQVIDRIRYYMAGDTAGARRGAEEIRTGIRLLLNLAPAQHTHGER